MIFFFVRSPFRKGGSSSETADAASSEVSVYFPFTQSSKKSAHPPANT